MSNNTYVMLASKKKAKHNLYNMPCNNSNPFAGLNGSRLFNKNRNKRWVF